MLRSKLQQFVARITLPLLACLDMLITTHVNISRVITGLLERAKPDLIQRR